MTRSQNSGQTAISGQGYNKEIRIIESTDIDRALHMAENVRMEYTQEQLLQMAAKGQVTFAGCYAGSDLLAKFRIIIRPRNCQTHNSNA